MNDDDVDGRQQRRQREDIIFAIKPAKGRLSPLKTKAEIEAILTLVNAYVVEIEPKNASKVLRQISKIVDSKTTSGLQHLRRFAKPQFLPVALRSKFLTGKKATSAGNEPSSINSLLVPRHIEETSSDFDQSPSTVFLLACSASVAPVATLNDLLSSILISPILIIQVPSTPPRSEEEALIWSSRYWPTIYKKCNPFGPQTYEVAKAETEIEDGAAWFMSIVYAAARASKESGRGLGIGSLIVNPKLEGGEGLLTVAGDARWMHEEGANVSKSGSSQDNKGIGNPLKHAALRAISLVAEKRLSVARRSTSANEGGDEKDGPDKSDAIQSLTNHPIDSIEQAIFEASSVKQGGYLCTGLDIYLSHEPCIMCTMAILHSRFNKVVFGRRMARTGGLTAEIEERDGENRGLGYGLWWRPELNWKLLAWQWDGEDEFECFVSQDMHA